ncbi:hypothetical protein ACHAP3_010737 [Botrytis cinerea]
MEDGAIPVEDKSSPYCMSGIAGGKKFSSYSESAKLKSTGPASPLIRTPTRAPKLLRSVHRKHPDYNPPLTSPPNSPIPLPSPSPEDRQGRIVDRVSERLPKSHGSSPKSPPSRWTQLFQENSPQSETPSLSTPGVVLQRRSASPVIRPAKIIYRQR